MPFGIAPQPKETKVPQKVKKRTNRQVFSYEKKPIARIGRECLVLCNQIAANMSKTYKYQLGSEICKCGTELVSAIYLALDDMGYSQQKENDIKVISDKLITLIVVVRVARDINQVSQAVFESLISKIVSIKVQTENWLGFIQKENAKNETEN